MKGARPFLALGLGRANTELALYRIRVGFAMPGIGGIEYRGLYQKSRAYRTTLTSSSKKTVVPKSAHMMLDQDRRH